MSETVRCDKCNGTGRLKIAPVAPIVECKPIRVGSDLITCYATRPHPGEPHMAILCRPCAACGGYDECDESCCLYPAEPSPPDTSMWFRWEDGDLALTPEPDYLRSRRWREQFQPEHFERAS